MIADRGYDKCEARFREALTDQGIEPCIPGRENRKHPIQYDTDRYKQRNRSEGMFGRLKDWPSPSGSNRWRTHGSTSQPDTTAAPTPT